MTWYNELDLLEEAEREAHQVAETMSFATDVDRRKFVFLSLATAAATTFGFGARALSQGAGGAPGAIAGADGGNRVQQPAVPPVPLDNMEEMSWTFQPYPGGTGALLEKTYNEKGMAAFKRQQFAWNAATPGTFALAPWGTGPLPSTDEDIAFLPAHRIAAAIKAGKLTSTRITKIYLERLKRLNPTLLCAVTILDDMALADAARMDAELKGGKYRGPLHGIPWGVKDLFAVKGTPTTWGAADFENRVIDEDSEIVVRLRDAGAVLIAKLSTGQFAQGGNWFRGGTKNPWNTTQSSSGSSAGPGSATGGGCVAFGIGTETDGSIIGPATTCGLTALRPTFGRVSRYGGMVLSWSQDRVGPLTRNAEDAAMVFNVLHGADPKDPSTVTMPFHFNANINLAGLRMGVRRPNTTTPNPVFEAFVDKMKSLGAKPVDMGEAPTVAGSAGGIDVESAAAFDSYVQMKAKELNMDMATVMTTYARGSGRGAGAPGAAPAAGAAPATPPVNRANANTGSGPTSGQLNRWVPGRVMTAFDFINSQRRRLMLITAWQDYMKDTDLYLGTTDTTTHAQTGHPVAVVQIGFGQRPAGGGGRGAPAPTTPAAPLNDQPICTQIAGNLYNDDIILSVAHKYQLNTDFHSRRPKLG
jgi:Asp-tRNA(Asn)/Glu-tRNA(Gln) amidotransferase A subunit family amidase